MIVKKDSKLQKENVLYQHVQMDKIIVKLV